jgi:predicted DNA-binding transcriptional regulator YafY
VEQRLVSIPLRYEARLTLQAPAEAIRSAWGTVTAIDDATCEYRTGDDNLEWLALRVAMLGVDCEVLDPPELRDELIALSERLTRGASGTVPRNVRRP